MVFIFWCCINLLAEGMTICAGLQGNGWMEYQAMNVGSLYSSIFVGRNACESRRHDCISLHEGMVVDKLGSVVMSLINATEKLVFG